MRIKLLDSVLYAAMKLIKAFDGRPTDLKYFHPDKVRNILVVSSTAIGDTLLSTPAIRAVRQKYSHARIVAHFNVKNMSLFENNPDIDSIIPYYGGYRKFFGTIREFRRHNFDLALILHGNEPQATPMAYLSGARFVVKLPNTNEYGFLLSNKDTAICCNDSAHGSEQRLKIAELAGCTASDNRMVLVDREAGDQVIDSFLSEHGIGPGHVLVGFQAGASTVSRMWFVERFVELGRKLLVSCPGMWIIITGSPQEYDHCKKISEGIGERAVVSAGRIPLKYIPSLIRRVEVLVTGDTGTMHLAVAVGTPVVALFAVSDPKRSGPYYDVDKHTVIKKEKCCDPCISKKCRYQTCMEKIAVEEVYDAVVRRIINNPLGDAE